MAMTKTKRTRNKSVAAIHAVPRQHSVRPMFAIYLSAEEKELLAQAALKDGATSLGGWIREIAIRRANAVMGIEE